jgi:DNA topoisomerase IA
VCSSDLTPESVKSFLEPDQFRLYELIWRRFVATQMSDAVYDVTNADIRAGAVLQGRGYLKKCAFRVATNVVLYALRS